jgi:hypothetical protein
VLRATAFNGKPKATAWHLSEVRITVGLSRLRLAVKRFGCGGAQRGRVKVNSRR